MSATNLLSLASACVSIMCASSAMAQIVPSGKGTVQVSAAVHYDVSAPLRDMNSDYNSNAQREIPIGRIPRGSAANAQALDPVAQTSVPRLLAPTPGLNFDGIGLGFSGPTGFFTVNSAPPDTNGAVGATQYVQIVNTSIAVFDKATGAVVRGPVPTNTLWSGFGGDCQTNNDGDGSVVYDKIANRWVITQFSVTTVPYLQCVAVSTTSDANGSYYRYAFNYGNTAFPDYPKMAAWPDAYYITYNIFDNASTFAGAKICAFDRANMLSGLPATQQCFNTSTTYGGLLPSDLDGAALPPAGSPNPVLGLGSSGGLVSWKFHVDWATPANSTFTGPTSIATASYVQPCGLSGTCVPQAGTSQQLDALGDRLMHRLAYRNFGDHEALVLNHSVTFGSSVAVRWYEIRDPNGTTPTLYQSGTYAPDSTFRWMGSIAMDKAGNIALGYSASSSSINPAIRYTGRAPTDALNTMQSETSVIAGAGSQTGTTALSRWGDYTAMTIDPVDDCTFFYTNQYLKANGTFNWSTRIASFKLPGCGTTASDFSISVSPVNLSIAQNASGNITISTFVVGTAGTVSFSILGVPAGATATFSPTSVTAGATSALTISTGTAAPGTYTLTVRGIEGSVAHDALVALTITAAVVNDFSISATPTSLGLGPNASGTSTISTTVIGGSAGTVSLAVSGVPNGATASLSSASVTAGSSSLLAVNAGTAAVGTYTLTITGTEGTKVHSTTVTVTVMPAVVNDFSIGAAPNSLTLRRHASASSTILTAILAGSAGTVSLSISGVPSGATASLNPVSFTAGGSATLTVNAGNSAPGKYVLTVTGIEGARTHATSVLVTIYRH